MAYKFVKNLTTVNYTRGNDGRKYIVIHYTGNREDSSLANSKYFKSINRGASAHYFVDRTSVYQVVSDDDTAWAVGKNYGGNNLFGKCTNRNSISIEMCSNGGKIADATFNNTVELTKKLMKKYNIPASRVIRHYDCCSKLCPGWTGWVGSDQSIWKKFKRQISDEGESNTSDNVDEFKAYKVKVTAEDGLNIREKASADSDKVGAYSKGTVVKIVKENAKGTWGKTCDGWIKLSYTKKV